MENRTLEINLISARDLKDVNHFSKMDVYAAVWLSGDSQIKQKAKTNVDRNSGTSPSWNNFPMRFTFDESAANQNRLILVFKLRCERSLGGDKDVGEVYVPVKELLDYVGDGKSMQFVSYRVRKPSGKPKGALNFSYRFSQKVAYPVEPSAPPFDGSYPPSPLGTPIQFVNYQAIRKPSEKPKVVNGEAHDQQPVTSYPAQPSAPTYTFPPPVGYAYANPLPPPPPPPPSYQQYGGYPVLPPGYWYPPVPVQVQQPRKKSGTRLGAGLVGAIGAVLMLKVALLACWPL
jgi:hypothetical protein